MGHTETADQAIADLMNALMMGEVDLTKPSSIALHNAIDMYLLEKGYKIDDVPDIWNGIIQIVSS